jgi:hypothetical protein
MRINTATVLLFVALASGCGDARQRPQPAAGVPDVVGLSLEDAKEILEDAGVTYYVGTPTGQTPIVDHLWEVSGQDPPPGADAYEVQLDVDREC